MVSSRHGNSGEKDDVNIDKKYTKNLVRTTSSSKHAAFPISINQRSFRNFETQYPPPREKKIPLSQGKSL